MQIKASRRPRWTARIVAVAAVAPTVAATLQAAPALSAPTPASARLAAAVPAAAAAAPGRTNTKTRPIYLIHGYQWTGGTDCKQWNKTKSYFKDIGWTGKLITWGYYKKNENCSVEYGGDTGTDMKWVSRSLAWHIYNNYTSKGKTVDVVAHSMGGLVIRNAIARVKRKHDGFPSKLYVEDVVTVGTPHSGTAKANACPTAQCKQMRPGGGHLKWLNGLPSSNFQATGGTNWTAIGSHADGIISVDSATSFSRAQHKVRYPKAEEVGHSDYYKTGSGSSWTYWISSNYGKNYKKYTNSGAGPLRATYLGLYYHSVR
ncbi:esterase/lipase family protein [Actinomadura rudentiformis]|uniref:DUF7379 domain-containing protein n=1 Tax=Actinomadura rudentiformis TaxID=359158 RepID=A0A6H9YH89_9ACTN|nr:hypothetical protein [Actinomadura rudentiformis]KAB2345156.1 hypothetical protein F8566_28195 [Actinomadura rudentiformis]